MKLWIRFGKNAITEHQFAQVITQRDLTTLLEELDEKIFTWEKDTKKMEFRVFEEVYFDEIFEGVIGDELSDFPIRFVSYLCDPKIQEIFIALNNKITNPRIQAYSTF